MERSGIRGMDVMPDRFPRIPLTLHAGYYLLDSRSPPTACGDKLRGNDKPKKLLPVIRVGWGERSEPQHTNEKRWVSAQTPQPNLHEKFSLG
jgi:hypothetical protein